MPDILFEATGSVAVITLNRPDVLNSITKPMATQLRQALERVGADESLRAVVLTGAGRGFCAGQDLGEALSSDGRMPDLGDIVRDSYNPVIRAIRRLEKPVICAVNGVAAGAGANIALACDLVIAAKSASFVQAFARIGLIPDSGGTYFLPRLVGTARAMGLSLLGDKLSAEQAAQWGLIWECVEDAELKATVDELLARLAIAPTAGLAAAKRALYASAGNGLEAQLDLERDIQRSLGSGADYREGVAAFAEKRAPRFTGR
jgi:2-(1,2-epoxy-1,2-dihydrophenyl)acetyl-CoA isomerase